MMYTDVNDCVKNICESLRKHHIKMQKFITFVKEKLKKHAKGKK